MNAMIQPKLEKEEGLHGLVIGECFRFIMKDEEQNKTYLHYFTKREVWDFIEIHFMTTVGELYRRHYEKMFGRPFISDYYLFARYGVEVGEMGDDPFIHRCFKVYGVPNIEMVVLGQPAFKDYLLGEDGTWVVSRY